MTLTADTTLTCRAIQGTGKENKSMGRSCGLGARWSRFEVRRLRWSALVLGLGVLMVCGLLAPRASASESLNWATGIEAGVPAGAASNPDVSLPSVSCPSAGNCTAVGNYWNVLAETCAGPVCGPSIPPNGTSNSEGLIVTESSGVWAPGLEVRLPPDADSSTPEVTLTSVSCPSVGNCGAVGTFAESPTDFGQKAGNQQGLLLTETSGVWATGVEAVLPAGAASNPQVSISAVSCASAGDCTAVGEYTDSSNDVQGLLLTESSGVWAPGVEAALPADAGSNPNVVVSSVSCWSAGDCTAVGDYTADTPPPPGATSGNTEGLLLTQTSGAWATGESAIPPPDAAPGAPAAQLASVSCPSAGNCSAVGGYTDYTGFVGQGMLLTETSGVWAPAVGAVPPAEAYRQLGFSVSLVSCPSAGNCTAAGNWIGQSAQGAFDFEFKPMLLTETSGVWAPAVEGVLPANAGTVTVTASGLTATASDNSVQGLSCTSAGDCAAVGHYTTDNSGLVQGVLWTETSGAWTPGVEAGVPANAGSGPSSLVGTASDAQVQSVSCPSVGNCGAVGTYLDGRLNQQGLLVSAAPAVPPPAGGSLPPAGGSPSPAGGSPSPAGGTPAPAPVLSAVKLGSQRFPARKGTTLKLTVSQAAPIRVLITQAVKGHKVKGACERHARAGKRCTITLTKRTVTLSGRAGANAFKLKLPGLAMGVYAATITAQNANGTSRAIRLTFTITHA